MKAPKEQVIEYVEKKYLKEKDKWESGLRNQLFKKQDNYSLYGEIRYLENKLKHIRDKYGINE